jgi:hypothetical protein
VDVKDITAENVAKAVGGTVERDGCILCCCPVHEGSGSHNPSLLLSITDARRILFHCRSQNCDAQHFQAIRDHLIKKGLPRSHVGGDRANKEIRYNYQHLDGSYAWTKTRYVTKSGKKRFRCEVPDEATGQWSSGRPDGMPLLFNLAMVASVLAAYPATPLLVVEGEKDVTTAGELGLLATTNTDGAGQWRVEDTQTLIKLGARKVVLDYAEASFQRSPMLKQLIASRTADALELTNGITLEVRPASFRKLRGPTYVAVIADELAFWYVDTAYANPDVEILNAVEPGLATTGGPLIFASSPHARRGVLWDVFRRHYGAGGDPLILVAHGASRTLNPSLPQRVVDRALEKDRTRATAEYLAEFRTDVEGFVALEVVESCVGDHREMLPAAGVTYRAFVDPSGGSEGAMTLAIAHGSARPDERVIVDAVREVRPPFSPLAVVDDFAALL